jgi:hypothetical protein
VREAFIAQAVIAHMWAIEFQTRSKTDLLTIERDIATRYIFTGIDFLVEIYDCLGGYQKIAETPSYEDLWAQIEPSVKTINTAVRALAFLHHAVDRFGKAGTGFVPSLNKAVMVFDELKSPKHGYPYKEKYVSRSLLHERWSQSKPTLALLYAASTVRINRQNLLELILSGTFSYEKHGSYLDRCVRRARYITNHIFDRMSDGALSQETYRLLGDGEVTTFAPPHLDEMEAASFQKIFRNFIND